MKRKISLIVSLLLVTVLLFSGCAASSKYSSMEGMAADMAAPEAEAPKEEIGWGEEEMAMADSAAGAEQNYGGHKVIKTAYMDIQTKNFDEDLGHIKEKVAELGGYVASSSIRGTKPQEYGDHGRSAEISLRVPQEKLETFMEDARGLAEVTYEDLGTDDITYEYFDTQSRLEIYQTQYDRLLKLLREAEEMEDIITLENELTRVTYEIEALTSTLKNWDDLVSFSTITVTLIERNSLLPISGGKDSMGTRMGEGFMDTLSGMAVFFEDFLVWIVSALPVLVLLILIAVIIVLIVKGSVKRSRKRRQAFVSQQPYGGDKNENKTE